MYLIFFLIWVIFNGQFTPEIAVFGLVIAGVMYAFVCKFMGYQPRTDLLLAKKLENDSRRHLATMDLCAERNAYGRQLGSYETAGTFADCRTVPMVFIRAPHIVCALSDQVEVLAQVNGRNAISWEDKFAYDAAYVRKITFLGDVSILLNTVKKAFVKSEGIVLNALEDFDEYRKHDRAI